MKVTMGGIEMEMGGRYMTELQSANDLLHDVQALRERLDRDGYLLLRGLLDRSKVLEARRGLLSKLEQMNRLDPSFDLNEGVIKDGSKSAMFGGPANAEDQELRAFYELVGDAELLKFFGQLLGGEAMTYDYKWPRAVAQGDFTGAHYDIVYMGRGTPNVYTMWTPLGDIPFEQGPLAVCLNSHQFSRVKETYGQMDVDRDKVATGWFSTDPLEMVDSFGGRWATCPFEAGDVMIFGMYLMHASLDNTTNRYRLSADTRFQLKSEPADERWIGKKPKGHYAWNTGAQVPVSEARKEWGV